MTFIEILTTILCYVHWICCYREECQQINTSKEQNCADILIQITRSYFRNGFFVLFSNRLETLFDTFFYVCTSTKGLIVRSQQILLSKTILVLYMCDDFCFYANNTTIATTTAATAAAVTIIIRSTMEWNKKEQITTTIFIVCSFIWTTSIDAEPNR